MLRRERLWLRHGHVPVKVGPIGMSLGNTSRYHEPPKDSGWSMKLLALLLKKAREYKKYPK